MPDKFYYKDGSILDHLDKTKILHREDGPAIEYSSGTKYWFQNGKRHRINRPAIEYSNGKKEYWINGKQFLWNPIKLSIFQFEYLEI